MSVRRAAALCAQLPAEARVRRAEDPTYRWGEAEYLLAAIEYDLRVIAWQLSGDGRASRPAPMRTPADEARYARMRRADPERIARELGVPEDRR